MAIVLNDRVRETTQTVGTGSYLLLGAVDSFQGFSSIGNGNSTYYCVVEQGGVNWEVGVGTYNTSTKILTRDSIISSSNGGSAVNFLIGTKDIFGTLPASIAALITSLGTMALQNKTAVDIEGGTIDNTVIGSTTPAAGTFTLISNSRINPRVTNITSSATITPPSDTIDQYSVTSLAVPANIAIPSGTPVAGQKLIIRIEDNGTARALTWAASGTNSYRVIGSTLPTTTVASKVLYVGCIYNATESFWDVVAVAQQV